METDLTKDEYTSEQKRIHDNLVERIRLLEAWKRTFSTMDGRLVLMDILNGTFLHESIFTGNSKTYYNAAIQDMGKQILDTLATADPETYLWVHTQRANLLKGQLDDEIKSVNKEADES